MSEHVEQRVDEKGAKSRLGALAGILGFSALMVVIGVAVSVRSVLWEKEKEKRAAESKEEKLRVLEVRIVAQQAEEKKKILDAIIQERSSQSKTDEEKVQNSELEAVPNTVTVAGGVVTPGPYPISPGMTMLDALNKAGGLTSNGTIKRVIVFREGTRYALNLTLERHQRERVYPDDVVMFDVVQVIE